MFFIMGVTDGSRQLDFSQLCTCKHCGRMGRYEAFVTYMVFTLFFIPVIKWSKRYFVRETVCGASCEISRELGRRIERGENVTLAGGDLDFANNGNGAGVRRCSNCGYSTEENFAYCPVCGKPFAR